MPFVVVAVVVFASWLASSPAPEVTTEATRGGITLRWSSPSACGDAQGVLDDALALLVDPVDPAVTLRVDGTVTQAEGAALVLRLGEGAEASERRIDAARCDELPGAAALLIAMAIDPSVGVMPDDPLEQAPKLPAPAPAPAPVPAPVAKEDRAPTPARPPESVAPVERRTPLHVSASIGAGVGAFTLPRVTADLELAFAIATRRARVEVGASWWPPVEATSTSNATIRGRFQLAVALARGCYVLRWRVLEFPLCAAVHAGAIVGRGAGALPDPRSARGAWIGLGGGPTILWRPRRLGGRLGLWLRGEGLGALTRPVFETAPSGLVWRAGEGALTAQVGAEVRLWSRR